MKQLEMLFITVKLTRRWKDAKYSITDLLDHIQVNKLQNNNRPMNPIVTNPNDSSDRFYHVSPLPL